MESIAQPKKLISELHMSDGDTVVQLADGMLVSFINNGMPPPNADGSRQESYWELEYNKEKMKLNFYPKLKIGK